ncbi:unnamed protein product [Calicophoron daubneyi]|uniref:39S ribosomal protein L30, mitochondrial n=1 Tax=Calicophoron daubneyi TaxID=300641 RepID=A0AAV2TLN9_CALDB
MITLQLHMTMGPPFRKRWFSRFLCDQEIRWCTFRRESSLTCFPTCILDVYYIARLTKQISRCPIWTWSSYRQLCTSGSLFARARTYESKPVPGSEEYTNPSGWAKRLFQLEAKKKSQNKASAADPPPLLHMVCRLKPLKGVPHYQRAILEKYGLGSEIKNHTWVVVKNIPSVNEELYVVKHLVRIQPIRFPQDLPSKADDLTQCRLLPDGRFLRYRGTSVDGQVVSTGELSPLKQDSCGQPANLQDPTLLFCHAPSSGNGYLTRSYLRQWHNRKWNNYELFNEYLGSKYKYKLNQDGMEYRYSRLWRLDNAMLQSIRAQRNPDGTLKQPNQNRFEANWCTHPWPRF